MIHSNKAFLSLPILILSLQSTANAESDCLPQGGCQLSAQVQQLQSQLKAVNVRIAALETAQNTAHQDNKLLRNGEVSPAHPYASNTEVRRTSRRRNR